MSTSRLLVIGFATLVGARGAWADDVPTVALAAEPSGRFEIGAGFDSDEGFLAHAGVYQDDLFHTGQRLALTADLGARWQAFRLRHEVDDLLGSGLDFETELFHERQARHGFTREGNGGQVTVSRALGAHTRGYLRYRVEDVDVDVDGGEIARALQPPTPALGEGLIATLRAGAIYDTLDDRILPTRGTRLEAYAETADRSLGSEHEWLRLGGSLDHARPLGPLTLRVHGRADYLRSADGAVPLSARLQHDGHRDIRGYPFGSLDELRLTPDGAVAAGDNFEGLGRVELELPVWKRAGLSIAVFGEAALRGNTDRAWGETGVELYRSAGASIIWRSPIGVLRFDWAIPFDGDDREPQFMFSIGGAL